MEESLAPITLFVYNRPCHTRQTLEALTKNKLADQSHLIVYCDGPKKGADNETLQKIKEVRDVIREQQWCKTIEIIESEANKGLANSVIEGVTRVVNEYGKIIVLEDDLVTSEGFLQYMNDALTIYKDEEKVMHISGYMYPVKKKLPDTFFFQPTSCWGWGTWARAWKYFEKNPRKQIEEISKVKDGWKRFTLSESNSSFKTDLEANYSNKINTWAIFWYASVFLKNGTSLHPYPSFINNIGLDGSGENCGYDNNLNWKELNSYNTKIQNKNAKELSALNFKEIKKFFLNKDNIKLSLRDRIYLFRKKVMNQ